MKHLGDITKLRGDEIPAVDIITGEILKKLTEIAESLASVADSLKKLGEASEGGGKSFRSLAAEAFDPEKPGCWNCKHRAYVPMDEFVHLECDIDGSVVGNSYHCDYWEKSE